MKQKARYLVLLLSLTACTGQDGVHSVSAVRLSPPILDERPLRSPTGTFSINESVLWRYYALHDGNVITFTPRAGGATQDETLTVPGSGVIGVFPIQRGGVEYLLVSALDSNDAFHLYRYSDADSDGVPDASTQTQLIDSGTTPVYVVSIPAVHNDRWYFLDIRCQDVLVARDTNSDGWPNTLNSVRYALADDFEYLKNVGELHVDAATGDVIGVLGSLMTGEAVEGAIRVRLRDLDADDVADTSSVLDSEEPVPFIYEPPYDGQTEMNLIGKPGKTVKVWREDAEGDPTVLLASHTFATNDLESVQLLSALVLDEEIHVRYDEPDARTRFAKVTAAAPHVLDMSLLAWKLDEGATIDVDGVHFTTTMTIKLITKAGNEYTLPYTFTSTRRVTVTVPALTLEDDIGPADIMVCPPDPTTPVRPHRCWICDPAVVSGP